MPTVKTAARRNDRYIRADDFASRIDGVELPPETWAVFAQLARPRSAEELARRLKLDPDTVQAALRRLARRKLVRKHLLAWRDYAATAPAAPDDAPPANAPAASTRQASPGAPDPLRSRPPFYVSSNPATRPRPIVSVRIASANPRAAAPVVSLRIDRSPTHTTAPATAVAPIRPDGSSAAGGLRLRPVLDAIGAKAGGGFAGQLLVYRIFLKLPTQLLQAAGLQSLSLVDDQFTLTHPELRAALAETVRAHAGLDIETLAA